MSQPLQREPHVKRYPSDAAFTKAIGIGAVAGLVGTIAMDLFGFVLMVLLGGPASLSFSIIGDAAAAFLTTIGITMDGGTPLGALLHYLIGIGLGILLGAAASRIDQLQIASTRRVVAVSILYVEIASLPMLAGAAIVLQMTLSATAQWFGISFVMHLVYGTVLGFFLHYWLRPAVTTRTRAA